MARKKKQVASDHDNAEAGEKPASATVGVKSEAKTVLSISSRDENGFVNVSLYPGDNQVTNTIWSRVKGSPMVEQLIGLGTLQVSQ